MNLLKGLILISVFCGVVWLIFKWSKDVCLDGGTYCEQKFCGDTEKIKACEQASIERWNKANPDGKAATQRVLEHAK
jgi:hypothetical protein